MIRKLFPNPLERGKTGSWSLNPKIKTSSIFFYLLLLFLPTQFGKHFWPDFSYVYGLRIDYLSPTLYFTDILIALLLLAWLAESVRHGVKLKINKDSAVKLALFSFLILFIAIGVIFSKSPLAGWYETLKIFEFSILGLYAAKNFRKAKGIVLFSIFIFGTLAESILAIAQYLNQGSLGGILYFLGERTFSGQTPGIANASINGQLVLRPYGTFSHPNVLAAYLLIFMVLIILASKNSYYRKQSIIFFSALVIGTVALFITMSRTAIAAWLVILALYAGRAYLKRIRGETIRLRGSGAYILTLLAAIVFLFTFPVGTRFMSLNFTDQTVVQREELITDALVMFEKRPIEGVGLNNFLVNTPPIQKRLGEQVYIQPVHNIFLLVLSETGAIGFILFLLLLFKTYKKIEASRVSELYILFFAVIFLGLFDHYFLTLQQGQLLFTFLFALFWSERKTKSIINDNIKM